MQPHVAARAVTLLMLSEDSLRRLRDAPRCAEMRRDAPRDDEIRRPDIRGLLASAGSRSGRASGLGKGRSMLRRRPRSRPFARGGASLCSSRNLLGTI